MRTLNFNLATLLFVVTLTPTGAQAQLIDVPEHAPLSSAACARRLLGRNAGDSAPALGRLTVGERKALYAVRKHAPAIDGFLKRLFPHMDSFRPRFRTDAMALLWRRLPELHAPTYGERQLEDDGSFKVAWREFVTAVDLVAVSDAYLPSERVIKRKPNLCASVANQPPTELAKIDEVNHDPNGVFRYLRQRYPVRKIDSPGWADWAFNLLWMDTFGVRFPGLIGDHLPDVDNTAAYHRRLVDEWRFFLMVLNHNR